MTNIEASEELESSWMKFLVPKFTNWQREILKHGSEIKLCLCRRGRCLKEKQ